MFFYAQSTRTVIIKANNYKPCVASMDVKHHNRKREGWGEEGGRGGAESEGGGGQRERDTEDIHYPS